MDSRGSLSGDLRLFNDATRSTAWFVYDHLPRIVLISLLWVLASLPLVTIGISALGAYTAVATIEERNRIEWGKVREQIMSNGRDATLLAPLSIFFFAIAGLYITKTTTESAPVATIIAVVAFYIAVYVGLLLIPTFVLLAHGVDAWTALGRARAWVGRHPTLALSTAFMTVLILTGTALLTVGFPLLFGGVACSYHIIILRKSGILDTQNETNAKLTDGVLV